MINIEDVSVIADIGYHLTMVVLLLLSIISITVIIERAIFYSNNTNLSTQTFLETIREFITKRELKKALSYCEERVKSITIIIKSGLMYLDRRKDKTVDAEILENELITSVGNEKQKIERYLGILASIGTVSPLIGLFGTVLGIMRSFHDMSIKGESGFNVVADGVSQALYTTAFGIIVAVPALILYNYFSRKSRSIVEHLDSSSLQFINIVKENYDEGDNVEK